MLIKKTVSSAEARQILFARMLSKTSDDYHINIKNHFGNNIPEKLNPWSWSMNELLGNNVIWYETYLTDTQLFNGLYRSVCNTYGFYVKESPVSVAEIKKYVNKFPDSDRKTIELLRKEFDEEIPVIVVTLNNKDFFVYDGFHASIAKSLDGFPIKTLVAYIPTFSCLFKRPSIN